MEWTQLRVNGTLGDRDTICAVMCMLDSGLMIEDYSDIDMDTVYADLLDEVIPLGSFPARCVRNRIEGVDALVVMAPPADELVAQGAERLSIDDKHP